MTKGMHEYTARLIWNDSTGGGTIDYASYSRQYHVLVAGKPDLVGSADAAFRGEADKHNPEDLFLAAISSCHMLSYLALCARKGVRVLAYEDEVHGRLKLSADGGGKFEEVTLHPRVKISDDAHVDVAMQLHDTAHKLCFIAQSCSVPIRHEPSVRAG
jgi:organic hydroperoxide reductase OsmC/OhrA